MGRQPDDPAVIDKMASVRLAASVSGPNCGDVSTAEHAEIAHLDRSPDDPLVSSFTPFISPPSAVSAVNRP